MPAAQIRNKRRSRRSALLFVLWVLLPPAPAIFAADTAGKWTTVQGSVGATRPGGDTAAPARPGEAVNVGELIEAGQDARARFTLADDTVVSLSSGTSLRVLQYSFDPASGRRSGVIRIGAGRARFIVAARRNSRFRVESPQATVAVDAADLVAIVTPGQTTVAVLDGSAKVRNASNLIVPEIELWANQSTAIGGSAAPSHPATITPRQRKQYRDDARLSR